MADKVDRYETSDLPERCKVALRFADALMTMPGDITEDLGDDLRRHFRPEQIVELTVDVMKWNYQKVPVVLGLDAEVRPGTLTELSFDAEGRERY